MTNLANELKYDYGLSSIPPSTSEHLTQGNETNLVIESVQGAYQEGENEMEEDCLKNNQIASGPSNNPKPKSENNAWKEVVGVNTRTQLFNEIEAVNPDNDYNITIMTSNLSLDTSYSTHKEPKPVKDPEEISRLRELYEEAF